MAKYSNNPIPSKHTDWSSDPTAQNLPFSGQSVQNWLKETIDKKAGCFYYDTTNNRFLVFSDEENRDLYLSDPTEYVSLLIGTFDAPFNYTASIELVDTAPMNYVQYGSVGNYIKARFDVVNKSGASIGENVNVTITFKNGSATTRIVRTVPYGTLLSVNIDEYLLMGTNIITIAAVGQNTLAATSIGLTYNSINLVLSDSFDISRHISPIGNLDIAFNISGSGIKRLEWFIDGVQVPYDSQNDDVTASEASRTKTIPLSPFQLPNGRHNLQYRAYVDVGNGYLFYSDTLFRDFIVDDGFFQDYLTVVSFDFPYNADYGTNGIIDAITEPIPIYGAEQYSNKEIKYAVNFPPAGDNTVAINLGGSTTEHTVILNEVYSFNLQSFDSGNKYLSFSLGTNILEFNVSFSETQYSDLEEVTNGLVFAFNKNDRDNSSDNRDSWSYGTYSATLNGFDWTDRSGWTNEGLLIPEGASFVTNFAPLLGNVVETGRTIEIEFETQRVTDDNSIICDLRDSGAGLLITASEASLTSRGGVKVSTKYKSGVPLRISFVVNSPNEIRNDNLLFIYIDGILAGAMNYPTVDSFTSNTLLQFAGTADATILIKQIRCYSRALSASEVLNNYILYRPTTEELVSVYERNDILDSNGQPSYEKLAAYTPVILITGDVEKLMNFDSSDRKTYVRMDKIEIINNFDTTKNLTIINPSMRCQGTSSMAYPRKNFRFYLAADNKDGDYVTRVFDYEGNELPRNERVYSFKEGAQPVDCWCLKADYAESSSTHNTGVARLWNDVMKHAKISNLDSRYYVLEKYPTTNTPCRTLAQHAAEDNHYGKDVRTTVDGFPITLFYHRYEGDPLICLGKYNWNNDKSTESVYGFRDIPGFDDSKVECWEVLESNSINQFTDLTNWDASAGGWRDAFEARYPDDSGKTSEATRAEGALKTVSTWINSTQGASKVEDGAVVVDDVSLMDTFKREKWEYLDVYKVAAYYVYLMRFGGVDQTVKNAMFTTEDGEHWFYINYDNDTILGVRNDGLLRFGYDIDRQSRDPDDAEAFCYAGHSSVLWNNLEADSEFMNIVKIVDQALFDAGLTYPNVINMFNVEQSGKWSERLHNYDYTYKYLDVWLDDHNFQLEKLQGPRRTHREWWLANRFAIYDAKNMTGQYLNSFVSIKPLTATLPAQEGDVVIVTPKVDGQVFGWEVGRDSYSESTTGRVGEDITFDLHAGNIEYNVGAPLKFYNSVYMEKIDVSAISSHISEFSFENVNSDVFGSYLEEVIAGTVESSANTALRAVNNLNNVKYLRKFVMCNFTSPNFTNIDLSSNIYLEEIDLRGDTGLASVTLPDAAPISTLKLPTNIQSVHMKDLVYLDNLTIEQNGASVTYIDAVNCKPFTTNLNWLKSWISGKTDEYLQNCTVVITDIDWTNVSVEDLLAFGKIGSLTFKGKIQANLTNPEVQIPALQAVYGLHCFDSTNELWIRGDSRYTTFIGPSEVIEGRTANYQFTVIGAAGTIEYRLIWAGEPRPGVAINSVSGQLITELNNYPDSDNLTVQAIFTPTDGSDYWPIGTKSVSILKETYPTNEDIIISGDTEIYDANDRQYRATVANTESYTGWSTLRHTWSLSGDLASYYRISSSSSTELTCVITRADSSYTVATGALTIEFTNALGTIVAYKSINIFAQSANVAVSRAANPEIMTALWSAYGTDGNKLNGGPPKIANRDYVTKSEAANFSASDFGDGTSAGSIFNGCGATHFEEIQEFHGLTSIPGYLFSGLYFTKDMTLPVEVTTVKLSAFTINANTSTPNPATVTIHGAGVVTVNGPDGYTKLPYNLDFPECTSIDCGNTRFLNESHLYLPKCTSFVSSFYSASKVITVTLGYLGYNNSASMGHNGYFNLVVSKYCQPTQAAALVGSTGNWGMYNMAKSISLEDGVTDFEVVDGCLYDIASKTLLHAGSDVTSPTIKAGTLAIGPYAFVHTTATSITIPSSVTSIGYRAFIKSSLSSVTLNSGLLTIGYDAFRSCTSLSSITIPNTVTSIGNAVFMEDSNLASVTFEATSSITTMGNEVFKNCTSLTSLTTPDSLTSWGTSALEGCSALEYLSIGSNHAWGTNKVLTGTTSLRKFIINNPGGTSGIPWGVMNYPSTYLKTAGPIGSGCDIEFAWTPRMNTYYLTSPYLEEITLPSTITYMDVSSVCGINVSKLYCYASTAPASANNKNPFTYGTSGDGLGKNNASAGINELHVPVGATGYDSGFWNSTLVNTYHFTVIYDLVV